MSWPRDLRGVDLPTGQIFAYLIVRVDAHVGACAFRLSPQRARPSHSPIVKRSPFL
jgi:hypothetical protein